MSDKDLSGLQNIQQLLPRREPKIILERAEYIFPTLKNSLVSAFVFVWIEQKTIHVYFQKVLGVEIFPLKLIFLLIFST
jgi:hypothetical protein